MDRKRIILLGVLLGLALALLGVLMLTILRPGPADPVAAAAEPTSAPLTKEIPTDVPPTAEPTAVPTEEPTPAPTADPRLQLSWGPVAWDVTELVLPSVTEGDLDLIRSLPDLTLLDGRTCENGAMLHAYSETVSYPVLWSVSLGDMRVDSDAEELAVPASVTTAQAVQTALQDLPHVQTVDLRESGFDNEQVAALREALPGLKYLYSVTVQGVRDDGDTRILELNADAGLDWETLAQEIALLPNLEKIAVTGALTPEQATYLLEGASDLVVTYSVVFRGRTISSEDTEADFSDLSPADLGAIKGALAVLPNIRKVNLDPKSGKSKWTLDEADQLQTFREGMVVNYTTKAFGVSFSLADEVVSFNKKNLRRKVNELKELLPYLRNVKRVDMENCGINNETMAALRDQFPQPKLVWRVAVGGYTVRTDAWMIKFSAGGGKTLEDKDVKNLKYCRELRYMDVGHNGLHHMDFVSYMPDLEVCIMLNPMIDIKGVENCPKLEYFECFSGMLKDLTPLAACTELKHLNICYNHITDIQALYGLTKLERLWMSRNNVPTEQIARFKELVPGCEVNTTIHNPTEAGWRKDANKVKVPRYELLSLQFRYDRTKLRSYGDGWWDDGKVHMGELPPVA